MLSNQRLSSCRNRTLNEIAISKAWCKLWLGEGSFQCLHPQSITDNLQTSLTAVKAGIPRRWTYQHATYPATTRSYFLTSQPTGLKIVEDHKVAMLARQRCFVHSIYRVISTDIQSNAGFQPNSHHLISGRALRGIQISYILKFHFDRGTRLESWYHCKDDGDDIFLWWDSIDINWRGKLGRFQGWIAVVGIKRTREVDMSGVCVVQIYIVKGGHWMCYIYLGRIALWEFASFVS